MKVSSLVFSAACLFLATNIDCRLPLCDSVEGRHDAGPCERMEEIDAMMEDARVIIRKLEHSESLVEDRIDDLQTGGGRKARRGQGGGRSRPGAQIESLLAQLEQVRMEINEVEARLDGLRTEKVKLQVWQDLLDTAAEREEIDSFLGLEEKEGPLHKLSSRSNGSGEGTDDGWGIRYAKGY